MAGAHRARSSHEPYKWLGASAVAVGIGVAMAGGTAVAYADDNETGSTSRTDSPSDDSTPGATTRVADDSGADDSDADDSDADDSDSEDSSGSPADAGSLDDDPESDNTDGDDTESVADDADDAIADEIEPVVEDDEPESIAVNDDDETGTSVLPAPDADSSTDHSGIGSPGAEKDSAESSTQTLDDDIALDNRAEFAEQVLYDTALASQFRTLSVITDVVEPALTTSDSGADIYLAEAISTPLTVADIFADVLTWIGLGSVADDVPAPELPVSSMLEALWLGVRQNLYEWNNQRPTVAPTMVGPDPGTGVVTGQLNGADHENDALTYTITTEPLHGTVTVNPDGSFTYTPDSAYLDGGGPDSFTVLVDDMAGNPPHTYGLLGILGIVGPTTTTITVTVPNVPGNRPPRVGDPGYGYLATDTVTGVVTGNLNASDPDNDPLVYSLASGPDPTLGTVVVDPDTGVWTFAPTAQARNAAWLSGAAETAQFDIAVSDGEFTTNTTISVPIDGSPVVATIPIGDSPFEMEFSPDGRYAYITHYADDSVTILDTTTNEVTRVDVGQPNGVVVVDPDSSKAYVTTYIDGYGRYLTVIDPKTSSVVGGPYLLGQSSPGLDRIVITPDGKYIYAATDSFTVIAFDTEKKTTIGGQPIVDHLNDVEVSGPVLYGFVRNLLVSPDGARVYVLGSSSTLPGSPDDVFTIINAGNGTTMVNGGAGGLNANAVYDLTVISDDGRHIYTVGTESVDGQWVSVVRSVDTLTNDVVATSPPIPFGTRDLAVSPDGNRIYALGSDGITVLTASMGMAVEDHISIPESGSPSRAYDLIVSGDGERLYVVASGESNDPVDQGLTGAITYIDTSTNTVIGTPIRVPTAQSVSLSPDGSKLYVLNFVDGGVGQGSVTVLDTGTSYVDPATVSPSSYADLYQHLRFMTADTDEGVYIETVLDEDTQDARIIVYLGGTTDELAGPNQGQLENGPSYSGDLKPEQLALIDAAVEKAPGAEVMLVGYSQGGMDAQNIAASGRYNVTSVVSYGAPIVQPVSDDYETIHLADPRDKVAQMNRDPNPLNPLNIVRPEYHGYYVDAVAEGKVFDFESSTVDPGNDFWAVHVPIATYRAVSDAFESSNNPDYVNVKIDVERYLGQPIVLIPDGYQYVDGALVPSF